MRPLIAVHGFMYDPKDQGGSNSPEWFFADMEGIAGREVVGFSWYSAPFGFRLAQPVKSVFQTAKAWVASWGAGSLHPYRHAWKLAVKAADDLVALIESVQGPVDIVAHSLGARVVLTALPSVSPKVRRVVFFNGAELSKNARPLAALTSAQFLNICVSSDRVLSLLGANFSGDGDAPCLGSAGLLPPPLANWRDLVIDDPAVQARARARGWRLRGNDPKSFMDHGEAYRFAGNSRLVQAWLDGDDLLDLFT